MLQEVSAAPHLEDVTGPECFWTHTGTIIYNIYELAAWLDSCSEYEFAYHVNDEKNDFARWIEDVVGDHVLAKKLEYVRDKETYAKKIRNRLNELTS